MSEKTGVILTADRLFLVARGAYERLVKANESFEHTSAGLTAIVFAAVSLEALVNEVLELASIEIAEDEKPDPQLHSFVEALDEIERSRGSSRLKYLVASCVLRGKPYDKGSQPYQDYALLMSLRDALVHLRPTRLLEVEGQTRIPVDSVLKELQSRGLVKSLPANVVASFIDLVATPMVVHWALSAASAMAQSFISMFPEAFRTYMEEDYAPVFRMGGGATVH
jgi:hypothetical protein